MKGDLNAKCIRIILGFCCPLAGDHRCGPITKTNIEVSSTGIIPPCRSLALTLNRLPSRSSLILQTLTHKHVVVMKGVPDTAPCLPASHFMCRRALFIIPFSSPLSHILAPWLWRRTKISLCVMVPEEIGADCTFLAPCWTTIATLY